MRSDLVVSAHLMDKSEIQNENEIVRLSQNKDHTILRQSLEI